MSDKNETPASEETERAFVDVWGNKCRKCRKPMGEHRLGCEHFDMASALFEIKCLHREEERIRAHAAECGESAQRWEWKYRVVKHENNVLRRKADASKAG